MSEQSDKTSGENETKKIEASKLGASKNNILIRWAWEDAARSDMEKGQHKSATEEREGRGGKGFQNMACEELGVGREEGMNNRRSEEIRYIKQSGWDK